MRPVSRARPRTSLKGLKDSPVERRRVAAPCAGASGRRCAEEVIEELADAADGFAEGQRLRAAEEEALLHVAVQRVREARRDAELSGLRNAVSQAANGEALGAGHA